jgi:hypothetical protein
MTRALIMALVLAYAAPAFAEARFFAEIPDLPLPPGYTETSAAGGFDSEQGRLVTAVAAGPARSGLAVRDFYYETLPQLGWSVSDENGAVVFQRGRERLHFFIEHKPSLTELRVQLVVRPASMNAD